VKRNPEGLRKWQALMASDPISLLKSDPNLSQAFKEAIQRPLPGADFQALTRRDEELPVGYGHPVDISDFKGGR
jgi:hypothetical protein